MKLSGAATSALLEDVKQNQNWMALLVIDYDTALVEILYVVSTGPALVPEPVPGMVRVPV